MPKSIGITEEIWWQVNGCEKSNLRILMKNFSKLKKAHKVKSSRTAAPQNAFWRKDFELVSFKNSKQANL